MITSLIALTKRSMIRNERTAVEHAVAALRGQSLLVVGFLLVGCGGKSASVQTAEVAGTGGSSSSAGTGGTELASGGQTDSGGPNLPVGGGSSSGGGGASAEAGAAGADSAACDSGQLITAILRGGLGGLGECAFAHVPGAGEKLGPLRGAVIFDSDGRIIDNTGLQAATKQLWLEELNNERWPCLAGQTLGYQCSAAG